MAVLEAVDLGLSIGSQVILQKINLGLEAGETLAILGPNGAGKSSLLRCLAGLPWGGELRLSGQVRLGGRQLSGLTPRSRGRLLSFMHQDTQVDQPLEVWELVALGRHPWANALGGLGPADHQAVRQAMEKTQTTGFARRQVQTLSGGERQRTMFARLLAQDTPVVLMDEPSASLDLASQEELFSRVARLGEEGRTVVAAVHDIRLASRFFGRILLMAGGRVVADGSPEAVLNQENLSLVYQVPVRVYRNTITGLVDFHIHDPRREGNLPHIHVIGGGGSAAGVLRLLGDGGYHCSAGVLSPGDTDLQSASVFGFTVVTARPFSPIGDTAFRDNCDLAARADLVVLCSLCWGPQNLRNLEAARLARRLLILEDSPPKDRDFTGGQALKLYRELCTQAQVMASKDFPAWLEGFSG